MSMDVERELQNLESESILRLLIKYGVPSIVTLLAISSYEMADRIIVGQFGSAEELVFLGVGLPFVFFLEATCAMVNVGSSCAISRTLGKNDIPSAQKLLGTSFSIAMIIGIIVLLAGVIFSPQIASICGADASLIKGSGQYIFYLSIGASFYFLQFVTNGALRAQAMPFFATTVVVVATVVNLALCLLFVAGFGWGARGSAMATMCAQIVGCLLGFVFLSNKRYLLHFRFKELNIKLAYVKEILGVGFSSALFEFSFIIYGIVLNIVLGSYNDPRLLAVNVTIASIILLINVPMTGIAEAAQTIIAYNAGSHSMKRIRDTTVYTWLCGVVILVGIEILILTFPEALIRIFVNEDIEFVRFASDSLKIVVLATPFMSSMLLVPDILGALGEAKRSIYLNLIALFIVQIPLILFLSKLFGQKGVWFSFPIYDIISTVVCVITLYVSYKNFKIEEFNDN